MTNPTRPNINKLIQDEGAFRSDQTTLKGENFMSEEQVQQGFDAPWDEGGGDYFTPDFSDTHDEVCLPDGMQVELRIASIKEGKDKNGAPDRRIMFEVCDEAFAKPINFYLGLPGPNDDARARNRKNLRLRDFLRAFGRPDGVQFLWKDLVGDTGWAIISLVPEGTYIDKDGNQKVAPEKNEVKAWVNK